MRLGLEGGSVAKEEGEDAPRLGREETGIQTGVEDRGVSERGGAGGTGLGGGQGCSPSAVRSKLIIGQQLLWVGGRGMTACGDLLRN